MWLCPPDTTRHQEWRLQIRIGNVVRGHMPFDVVDGDERFVCGVAQALHAADPGEQRADKPRPVGDGEGIDILQAHIRRPECLVNHAVTGFDVRTTGDFWNDAAIERMEVNLAENDVGDDGAPILDDGGGRFRRRRFPAPECERGLSPARHQAARGQIQCRSWEYAPYC